MTRVKKETVKATAEKAAHGSKEEILKAIDGLIEHANELRKEVEEDKEPSVTIVSMLCNENTGEVKNNQYGSGSNMISTLCATIGRDPSFKKVVSLALTLS